MDNKNELNLNKLTRQSNIISSEDALKDIDRIDWSDDVKNGTKKIEINTLVSSCSKKDV